MGHHSIESCKIYSATAGTVLYFFQKVAVFLPIATFDNRTIGKVVEFSDPDAQIVIPKGSDSSVSFLVPSDSSITILVDTPFFIKTASEFATQVLISTK